MLFFGLPKTNGCGGGCGLVGRDRSSCCEVWLVGSDCSTRCRVWLDCFFHRVDRLKPKIQRMQRGYGAIGSASGTRPEDREFGPHSCLRAVSCQIRLSLICGSQQPLRSLAGRQGLQTAFDPNAPGAARNTIIAFTYPSWRIIADSTLRCSQAVPHPSTNRALRRLTSEVGRDPVYSTRYGRQRKLCSSSYSREGRKRPPWDFQLITWSAQRLGTP